ncbi:hydroxymethylglutaryl-CoA synthase [Liquorilactobacillus vini DSM 20605]|uniref:Hydroxymethylglutaryl-CoA synthase n=2 Tax=Liquorilactobacillus vini TaxID=238015 RepID=A0A0R2C9H4_9LACO|nr:hydroxymethylglutaryl-CoA synthase [Liquorilactobacillus vini DSM 20605]
MKLQIGIDKIGFYTSDLYIDMVDLAHARNEDPNKYLIGIGQEKMAVIRPTQDAVTLAANAVEQILDSTDKQNLGLILFGTESGVDNSKSAASYLAGLLELPSSIRTVELKQACFAATAGLELAYGFLLTHPREKVLVIGADVARYGLKTPGEPTQGGGAVALLLSAAPRILALNNDNVAAMEDAMDFWRPIGESQAQVAGKFSTELYLQLLQQVWRTYQNQTNLKLSDFAAVLFHLPYTKLGLKGLRSLLGTTTLPVASYLLHQFEAARYFNRQVGNLYTGSLYLSFLSLLKNSDRLQAGDRLGFYSYGSGAQAEFFSGILQKNFKKQVAFIKTGADLAARKKISIAEYEELYQQQKYSNQQVELDATKDPANYVLLGIRNYQRQYQVRNNS